MISTPAAVTPRVDDAIPRRRRERTGPRALLEQLVADRGALLGLVLLLLAVGAACLAPLLAPLSPTDSEIVRRLKPPLSAVPGIGVSLLGTDQLGRDVLSRILFGARISLLIGSVAALVAAVLGLGLGLLAGYGNRLTDDVIMRLADIQLAFPFILLAIAVVAVIGPGLLNIIAVLGVAGWVLPARVVRAQVLTSRELEYVHAARALGASRWRIVRRHLLPGVLPTLVVTSSFSAAQMIIVESALSFLGLGVPPPTPSWGNMLSDGQNYLTSGWWVSTSAGVALMLTVLSINLLGDFLRDLLDPHLRT
jgi:peptide/nickel transport system permease protein